jgi:pyruvate kinase
MDLQGPKLRLAALPKARCICNVARPCAWTWMAPGDERRVNLPHPEIIAALEPGMDLLLDDGKLRLR